MKTLKDICEKCGSKELIYGTLESFFQRSHEFKINPYMELDNVPPNLKRFYPQLDLSTPVIGCKNCGYCWEDKPKQSFSPDDPELKMAAKKVCKMSEKQQGVIDNFEIEFDCPDGERGTLEEKLKLITLGNGKDLCIITCDDKGCKPAKLKVRSYDNVDKSYFKNGAIEIETDFTSLLANNCVMVYYVPEDETLLLGYENHELLVRIVHK